MDQIVWIVVIAMTAQVIKNVIKMDHNKIIDLLINKNPRLSTQVSRLCWNTENQLFWYCEHEYRHLVYCPITNDITHLICDFCCKDIKPIYEEDLND